MTTLYHNHRSRCPGKVGALDKRTPLWVCLALGVRLTSVPCPLLWMFNKFENWACHWRPDSKRLCQPECDTASWRQNLPPERARRPARGGGRGVRMRASPPYPSCHTIGVDSVVDRSARASESRDPGLSVEREIHLGDTRTGARYRSAGISSG